MSTPKPSITEFKLYTSRSGWIAERTSPCYSNCFIVYSDGKMAFDRSPSNKAMEELVSILKARGVMQGKS